MRFPNLGYIVAMAALTGVACQRQPAPEQAVSAPAALPQTAPISVMPPEADPASPVAPYPAATIELIERYAMQAQALSAQLTPGVDTAAAVKAAESLLTVGVEIVPAFVERHPHCGQYLTAAMQVQDGWRRMDAETLERDFHKDGALPRVEGDVKTCYHMKDLVVHPATALVLLSQSVPDIAGARKEITEVVAHAHVVKQG